MFTTSLFLQVGNTMRLRNERLDASKTTDDQSLCFNGDLVITQRHDINPDGAPLCRREELPVTLNRLIQRVQRIQEHAAGEALVAAVLQLCQSALSLAK